MSPCRGAAAEAGQEQVDARARQRRRRGGQHQRAHLPAAVVVQLQGLAPAVPSLALYLLPFPLPFPLLCPVLFLFPAVSKRLLHHTPAQLRLGSPCVFPPPVRGVQLLWPDR